MADAPPRGSAASAPQPAPARVGHSKRPLIWIAILCLAPFVASFVFYFWLVPTSRINYGTLLADRVLPDVAVTRLDGTIDAHRFRGKWTLLVVDSGACAQACAQKLYATRQARTMQGKERDRVDRVWLYTGDARPAPELVAAHPDLAIARAEPDVVLALSDPDPAQAIWLVDPLGNLVLRYPADPDIRRLHKDIARLLYASQIG
jgi:hypothetical protein